MKEADRSALRTSFENNGEDIEGQEYHVLCAIPRALGAGMTLTQASIVMFMEPWGKPTDIAQAWKRCHRVGCFHNGVFLLMWHLIYILHRY